MLIARVRSETMRWLILVTVDMTRARLKGMNTAAVLAIIQATYPDTTHLELRKEIDYLVERELVRIEVDPLDNWFVTLMRYGIEVVQYTCPCDPGIARPMITQA
jgi:hypothetical protein